MPADDSPCPAVLTSPHPGVAVGAVREISSHVHCKPGTKRGDGHLCTHTTDAKLLGNMCHEPDRSGPVRFHVLLLRSRLAVWTREEQVLRDQIIQRIQVCFKLCGSNPCLEEHNLPVGIADQD